MTLVRHQLDQLARLAHAVRSCPAVLQLHAGPTGRIASATATGRVVGLLFQGNCLLVGVIARRGTTSSDVAATVRHAVRPLLPGPLAVNVVVSAPPPESGSTTRAGHHAVRSEAGCGGNPDEGRTGRKFVDL